jgi:hypothetical protein
MNRSKFGTCHDNDRTIHEYSNPIILASPEERYQRQKKKAWYFDKLSWYMNGGYDNRKGCNPHTGCIPECEFYLGEGCIEVSS